MSCPTCDHTLHNLGLDQAGRRTFWCPRCGTLLTRAADAPDDVGVPYLVGHVKQAGAMAVHPGHPGGHPADGAAYYAVPGWHWRAAREAVGLKEESCPTPSK